MTTQTITRPDEKTHHIPMYKVIFHNDNKTTMNFVVWALKTIYGHEDKRAKEIMLEIHEKGAGIAGIYPLEPAEMKVLFTKKSARAQGFPLEVSLEPDA